MNTISIHLSFDGTIDVMQRILDLIDPPAHPAPPPPPPRKIGFSVKESPAKYATRQTLKSYHAGNSSIL